MKSQYKTYGGVFVPVFKTQLGEVNIQFKDFSSFSTFLDAYYRSLTEPIETASGTQNMPLIGIDGNITNDQSIFGNRQQIIANFIIMRDGYVREYGKTSILQFYNVNLNKVATHSGVFNQLIKDFDEEYKSFLHISKSIKTREELLLALRSLQKLKRIIGAAQEYDIELMLFKMMLAFLVDGLDFFTEVELFDDDNYDRLKKICTQYDRCAKKIKKVTSAFA